MGLSEIKKLAKIALYYGGYYTVSRRLMGTREKSLVILMYHDIRERELSGNGRRILGDRPTKEQFAAHLGSLKNVVRVVSLEQAAIELFGQGKLTEDSAAITFDDGYASVYKLAFPLLKQYNWPATVFLTTDWINGKMTLWWERLAEMIGKYDPRAVDFAEAKKQLGEPLAGFLRITNGDISTRDIALAKMEHYFRQQSDNEVRDTVAKLERLLYPNGFSLSDEISPLNWDEIRIMANSGINFGVHTSSHLNLSHASLNEAEAEIADCKVEIERQCQKKALGFAYPYGDDSVGYTKLEPLLKKLEFLYACTAIEGSNKGICSSYALRRHTLPLTTSRALLRRTLYLNIREKNNLAEA